MIRLLVWLAILVSSVATVWAGCQIAAEKDHSPPDGHCSVGRVKTNYLPSKIGYCSFYWQWTYCCDQWTVDLQRRRREYNDQHCTGPIVGDTGWVPIGTTTQAVTRYCGP